tara:strand:+ start:107 stop:802 length:696 start_codon:yes stop_codon:yes gene_type:complete
MNNRLIIFLFFLIGFLNSSHLIAQSNLLFGATGVQHEDTLHIGDSIHFSFWIVNQGPLAVNDSLTISCETFDNFGGSISSMSIGDYYNVVGPLNVGDSIFITITEVVSYASYVLGDNIIVIWPASIVPVDTSSTPIHVLGSVTSGAQFNESYNKLSIYPNPSQDYFIISNNLELPISGISVYNNLGNALYVDKNIYRSPLYFDLHNFQSGIYFIETIINNQRIIERVVLVK